MDVRTSLMHLSIETPSPPARGSMGHSWGLLRVLAPFVSEGVGDLLFFVASVLPAGWGISKVLTSVDERGLRRVSRIHVLSHPQRQFQDGRH